MIANFHTSGNSCASRHHAIFADFAVVSDMNQVVNFAAVADYGVVKSAAIHARIRPKFNIIAENCPSELRNFHPRIAVRSETETIGSDTRSGVDYAIIADLTAVINHDI